MPSKPAALKCILCGWFLFVLAEAWAASDSYLIRPPPPPHWSLYLESRFEYDTNVAQVPESDNNVQTGKADGSANAILFFEERPSFLSGTHLRLLGFYQGYARFRNFDLMGLSAGIEQDLKFREFPMRVRYEAQHFQLDRKPYLWLHSVSLEADLPLNRNWMMTPSYSAGIKKFVSSQNSDFDGPKHKAGFSLSRTRREGPSGIKAQAMGFRDAVRSGIFRYWGAGGSVECNVGLPLGVDLKLNPEAEARWYDERGTISRPYRKEFLQSYTASLSYFFLKRYTVEGSLARVINDSTDGNFVFRKWVAGIGFSVIF